MKERPILFSAPMVKALLAGTKTQTRRIINCACNQPHFGKLLGDWDLSEPPHRWDGKKRPWRYLSRSELQPGDWIEKFQTDVDDSASAPVRCPFGQPGDRLWVRETWRTYQSLDDCPPGKIGRGAGVQYEAGGSNVPGHRERGGLLGMGKGRPSIFMPRWASRITLEVTGVKVERLHDISEEDARAEGATYHNGGTSGHSGWRHDEKDVHGDARSSFFRLWSEINGLESLRSNPWVWAISFKRIEAQR